MTITMVLIAVIAVILSIIIWKIPQAAIIRSRKLIKETVSRMRSKKNIADPTFSRDTWLGDNNDGGSVSPASPSAQPSSPSTAARAYSALRTLLNEEESLNEYSEHIQNAKQTFLALTKSSGWKIAKEIKIGNTDQNVSLFRHEPSADIQSLCSKARMVIHATIPQILQVLTDSSKRTQWDRTLAECTLLNQISKRSALVYTKTRSLWPTRPREVVFVTHMFFLEDTNSVLVLASSVDESGSSATRCRECVRATVHPQGYMMTPITGGESGKPYTLLTCVVNTDPGGSIPSRILRMLAQKQLPKALCRLNDLILEYRDHEAAGECADGEGNHVLHQKYGGIEHATASPHADRREANAPGNDVVPARHGKDIDIVLERLKELERKVDPLSTCKGKISWDSLYALQNGSLTKAFIVIGVLSITVAAIRGCRGSTSRRWCRLASSPGQLLNLS